MATIALTCPACAPTCDGVSRRRLRETSVPRTSGDADDCLCVSGGADRAGANGDETAGAASCPCRRGRTCRRVDRHRAMRATTELVATGWFRRVDLAHRSHGKKQHRLASAFAIPERHDPDARAGDQTSLDVSCGASCETVASKRDQFRLHLIAGMFPGRPNGRDRAPLERSQSRSGSCSPGVPASAVRASGPSGLEHSLGQDSR